MNFVVLHYVTQLRKVSIAEDERFPYFTFNIHIILVLCLQHVIALLRTIMSPQICA